MRRVSFYSNSWGCLLEADQEDVVAKKALILKAQRRPKFPTRQYNRCPICGRSRAFLRKFGLCRICFRAMALRGEIPGVIKSSW